MPRQPKFVPPPDDNLSISDKEYISKHYHTASPRKISSYLEKPLPLIKEYIDSISQLNDLDDSEYQHCEELRALPEWKLFQKQFTPDEMIIFEQSYIAMREQFKDDILSTERKQVFQAIELDIFMHRIKINQRQLTEDNTRIRKNIEDEYDRESSVRDNDRIEQWENRIQGMTSAYNASAKQYNDYLSKHKDILDKLNATRQARTAININGKTNFLGMIKNLESDEERAKVAVEVELSKQSYFKEMDRLGSLHSFADGNPENPILNMETASKVKSDG